MPGGQGSSYSVAVDDFKSVWKGTAYDTHGN
jgi:hypothetical protein